MKHIFNNDIYPVATSEDEVVDLLQSDTVRAVMYRNAQWQNDMERARTGISFRNNHELAMQYHATRDPSRRRKETGQNLYMRAMKCEEVLRESADAGIVIDLEAVGIITERTNEIRDMYMRVLDGYAGLRDEDALHSRMLMTPKGGVGRTPFVHTDDVALAAHCTFNGAPLYLPEGVISDATWKMINRCELITLSEDACTIAGGSGASLASLQVEFGSARLGDVVFKKGALGKDLSSPEGRAGVCPHSSSPYISEQGQAGVIVYAKEPS